MSKLTNNVNKIALEEHFSHPELANYQEIISQGSPFESPSPFLQDIINRSRDFDNERVAYMDRLGISHMILSYFAVSVQLDHDVKRAIDMAQRMNDLLAARVAANPSRYSGFAILPLQDPASATAEFVRCITQLGFKGAIVNGHTHGCYLDEADYWPLWEKVEELGAPIFLHPMNAVNDQKRIYEGYPELLTSNWEWTVETATHALRVICSGLFDSFPKASLILGHMGEILPFHLDRFDDSHHLNPIFKPKKRISDYIRENIYINTSSNVTPATLTAAIMALGSERMLFATDYPFCDGTRIVETIECGVVSDSDKKNIYHNTARVLFKL